MVSKILRPACGSRPPAVAPPSQSAILCTAREHAVQRVHCIPRVGGNKKPASQQAREENASLQGSLPFANPRDFDDADRGFLGSLEPGTVADADGKTVWDNDTYSFRTGEAPATVNPSLGRQSKLVSRQGLYEVVEGTYQVRGLDPSYITFSEGDTGGERHRPADLHRDPCGSTRAPPPAPRPVPGGRRHLHPSPCRPLRRIFGVASQFDVDAGRIQVIATEGLVEHAVAKNVYMRAPLYPGGPATC